jgi:hypothetical protein
MGETKGNLRVNGDVESHELPELGVGEANLVGVVRAVIQSTVASRDGSVVAVLVVENDGCDAGHLGAEVNAVLESRLPILGLVHAALVGLHEVGAWLAGEDTHGELSHGVHVSGERADHSLFLCGQLASAEELLFEIFGLRFSGQLSSKEKPENAFRDGLASWDSGGSILADVEELRSTVRDALCGVELGGLVEHSWDSTHASDDLANSHLVNDGLSELLLEGENLLLAVGNDGLHALMEDG